MNRQELRNHLRAVAAVYDRRIHSPRDVPGERLAYQDGPPGRLYESVFCLLASVFCFLLLPLPARAQDYLLQTGSPTFTNAEPVEMGFINVANGNLHIEIPITSAPQRGSLNYAAKLVYDSRIWKTVGTVWSPSNVPNSKGGWRLVTPGAGTTGYSKTTLSCQYQCGPIGQICTAYYDQYDKYYFQDSSGTRRYFPVFFETGNYCHAGSAMAVGPALDGSGYWMGAYWATVNSVKAPDGTQVYPDLKDPNGNFFDKDGNGNVRDTLDRTPVVYEAGGTGSCTGSGVSYCYKVLNSQNSDVRIKVKTAKIDVWTYFQKSGVTEYRSQGDPNKQVEVITQIILPDDTSYSFGYDSGDVRGRYGLLTSMTLPTDGQVAFTYTTYADGQGNRNRWVNGRTSGGGTWSYAPSSCGSTCNKLTVTRPTSEWTVYTFTINNGAWTTIAEHWQNEPGLGAQLKAKLETAYKTDLPDPVNGGAGFVVPDYTNTTLPVPGGNLVKKTKYVYDSFNYSYRGANYTGRRGNLKTLEEYAFGVGSPGGLVRKTEFAYVHETDSNYTNRNIVNRASSVIVTGINMAQTLITYDSGSLDPVSPPPTHWIDPGTTTRGNATLIQRWVSGSTYLNTNLTYDVTGQVTEVTDPNNNTTSFGYAAVFYHDSGSDPPETYTPEVTTNAYLTAVTLPLSGSLSFGYYYNTGKLARSTDQNSQSKYFHFVDALDRPSAFSLPDGGGTATAYPSATERTITTKLSDELNRVDKIILDSLGRVSINRLDSDPEGATEVKTEYDSWGRIWRLSHPYRTSATDFETYTYDALSRVTTVVHPDASFISTSYGKRVQYDGGRTSQLCAGYPYGYPTLYKDEAGKKRQTWTDALGRVVEVDEQDSSGELTLSTCYSYDGLDNLYYVAQGSQTRSYGYDGLSRLRYSATPEAGAVWTCYSASASACTSTSETTTLCSGDPSAPCRRTDARGITTTYTYDALNRLVKKSYSDSTPLVKYLYDGATPNTSDTDCSVTVTLTVTNGAGRRTGMCDGSGGTAWSYDSMGRAVAEKRTITGSPNVTKTISYEYNRDGSVKSVTYPSGRKIDYTYSAAARPLTAKDTANQIDYATGTCGPSADGACYAPQGALASLKLGGTITSAYTFNNRLQNASITATVGASNILDLAYGYFANGNVSTITNNRNADRTQTFTYDYQNRVGTAQSQATSGSHCWGQSCGYDTNNWNNLTTISVTQCTAPSLSLSVNSLNQITNTGFTYNSSGDQTADGTLTLAWNAEERLTSTAGVDYTHDGDGWRVKKSSGKLQWRSLSGDILAETDLEGNNPTEYIYFAGKRIARRDSSGTIYYFLQDHLGSTRVIANSGGSIARESDYYPFGGERVVSGSVDDPHKFAGMYLDSESGLYYTWFRMYAPNLGRWLAPDPMAGEVTNPGSLNRYAYVANNPMNLIDPLGLEGCSAQSPSYPACVFAGEQGWGPYGMCTVMYDPMNCGPFDALHVDPFGHTVFDAIRGESSTFFDFTQQGNPVWGTNLPDPFELSFHGSLYGQFYNQPFAGFDAYADWRTGIAALPQNQPGYLAALNAQLAYNVEGLYDQGAEEKEVNAFLKLNIDNFGMIKLEGGNFHFLDPGFPFIKCAHNRCGNGLDFSHGGGYFHRDTANPYNFPGGTLVHLFVDVIAGQFVYFIPRH